MMKRLERNLRGYSRVEVCGAFPESVLNTCALSAVELWELECADEYTLRFCVYEADLPLLENIAKKCMCELKKINSTGGSRNKAFLKNHIWLLVLALVILALLCASTLFIWDIDVRGCEDLTEGEVLRALAACGVDCGSYWPNLSTDLIRSEMLTALPELAWMTVNVSSSRALVLVSERQEKPEIYIESDGADIVASGTGIIKKLSVLNGQPQVGIGQAVTEGETLISGTMDSITAAPRNIRAQGAVYADTWREMTAVCPAEMQQKTPHGRTKHRFAVKFGKNRVNFYFSSGNTVDGCDKIIHNYKLSAEGLFALPVTFVVEELRPYKLESASYSDAEGMADRLQKQLASSVTGEILSSSVTVGASKGLTVVTLRAACVENIAEVREYLPAD